MLQEKLKKIWESRPCHVVKARINKCSVYHGSFHTLKGNGLVNDEVISSTYVTCTVAHIIAPFVADYQHLFKITGLNLWKLFCDNFTNHDSYNQPSAIKEQNPYTIKGNVKISQNKVTTHVFKACEIYS